MLSDSPVLPSVSATLVDGSQVAAGLTLLRASTLKLIRLQLAMERCDRHVARKAMDDLITLDRRLQDYLEDVPPTGDMPALLREIDAERAMLNQEKLTLAAEILRSRSIVTQQAEQVEADVERLRPPNVHVRPPRPHRRRWWLAVLPILGSAMATTAYFVNLPDVAAWIAAIAGVAK